MTSSPLDALFNHANVSAESAEVEASALRVELRAAHDMIIRTLAVVWRQALADLLFYAHELHKRGGMSDAELVEDVAKIGGNVIAITAQCARYRRRWGAASIEEQGGGLRDAKALLRCLLIQTRPIHRRHKACRTEKPPCR